MHLRRGVNAGAAVRLEGITKRYGALVACDDVDLSLHRGRIHGLLGENGAGKSTLMKVIIGLVLPDAGAITINGERCRIADPLDAAKRGIAMVHQHFSLIEPLTVWENRGIAIHSSIQAKFLYRFSFLPRCSVSSHHSCRNLPSV